MGYFRTALSLFVLLLSPSALSFHNFVKVQQQLPLMINQLSQAVRSNHGQIILVGESHNDPSWNIHGINEFVRYFGPNHISLASEGQFQGMKTKRKFSTHPEIFDVYGLDNGLFHICASGLLTLNVLAEVETHPHQLFSMSTSLYLFETLKSLFPIMELHTSYKGFENDFQSDGYLFPHPIFKTLAEASHMFFKRRLFNYNASGNDREDYILDFYDLLTRPQLPNLLSDSFQLWLADSQKRVWIKEAVLEVLPIFMEYYDQHQREGLYDKYWALESEITKKIKKLSGDLQSDFNPTHLYKTIFHWRDEAMCGALIDLFKSGIKRFVATVGARHLQGLSQCLEIHAPQIPIQVFSMTQ